jgi:hypothetical protein
VTVAAGRIYALGGRTAGYDTNLALVELAGRRGAGRILEPAAPEPCMAGR